MWRQTLPCTVIRRRRDPAWRQVESAAYLVDASWCNEHNGDGQLQRNMAAFSLDSVAVDSNHIIVLPS